MAPRLIVNGDDLGRSESLSRGVMASYDRGILTSTTVVAGGPWFEPALALARERPDLGIGVHLVLDEYDPMAAPGEISSLLGSNGRFYSRPAALGRSLVGTARPSEVKTEWEAQVARVVDAGIRPSHLDGHGHCHTNPRLARAVLEIADRFGIPAIRLPMESLFRFSNGSSRSLRRYAEKLMVRLACYPTGVRWKSRLRFPDAFYGFMEAGSFEVASLDAIARELRSGVSELMVHPGVNEDDRPFSLEYDWVRDLETLTHYSKSAFEDRFGIQLVSYKNAWEETP